MQITKDIFRGEWKITVIYSYAIGEHKIDTEYVGYCIGMNKIHKEKWDLLHMALKGNKNIHECNISFKIEAIK